MFGSMRSCWTISPPSALNISKRSSQISIGVQSRADWQKAALKEVNPDCQLRQASRLVTSEVHWRTRYPSADDCPPGLIGRTPVRGFCRWTFAPDGAVASPQQVLPFLSREKLRDRPFV